MVNAPKKNFSPHPAGPNCESTQQSTQRRLQANEAMSGFVAERVRAPGALRSLRSRKKLAEEQRRETNFLSLEEKEIWIADYVDRETAGATKRVEDAKAEVQQEQHNMTHAEFAELKSRKPEKTCEQMLVAIGDSLSDLASSDDRVAGEDDSDGATKQGKLSEDDEHSWIMGRITKTVQKRMERFRQKQMKFDELTQLGWEDVADDFCEQDKKYGPSEWRVQAVIRPQTNDDTPPHPPTTFAALMVSLGIVPGL